MSHTRKKQSCNFFQLYTSTSHRTRITLMLAAERVNIPVPTFRNILTFNIMFSIACMTRNISLQLKKNKKEGWDYVKKL